VGVVNHVEGLPKDVIVIPVVLSPVLVDHPDRRSIERSDSYESACAVMHVRSTLMKDAEVMVELLTGDRDVSLGLHRRKVPLQARTVKIHADSL
jgi:hypothetical protein